MTDFPFFVERNLLTLQTVPQDLISLSAAGDVRGKSTLCLAFNMYPLNINSTVKVANLVKNF